MAFPAGPINGQTYTSAHGTKYVFSTAANGWLIDTTASGSGVSLPANASGYLKNDGIGTLTWGATQNYSEGAIAPTSPANGDEWYDTSTSTLKKRIAGAWVAQGGSSGGGKVLSSGALVANSSVLVPVTGYASLVCYAMAGNSSGTLTIGISSDGGSTFPGVGDIRDISGNLVGGGGSFGLFKSGYWFRYVWIFGLNTGTAYSPIEDTPGYSVNATVGGPVTHIKVYNGWQSFSHYSVIGFAS